MSKYGPGGKRLLSDRSIDFEWNRRCPIKFYELGDAYYKVWSVPYVFVYGNEHEIVQYKDASGWNDQMRYDFKKALGDKFARYPVDELHNYAVRYRSHGGGHGGWKRYRQEEGIPGKRDSTSGSKNGTRGELKREKISPELQAHYNSLDYAEKKDACRERDGVCRLCGENIEEFHHCVLNYDSVIGTPDELKHMTGVCRDCHSFADAARKNKQRVLKLKQRIMETTRP